MESVNLDRFGQFQSNLYHQLEQLATQLELFLQYARSGHNCLESKLLGMSREQEDICAKEGIIQQTEFEMRGSEHQQLSSSTSSCITKSMGIVEELKKSADGLFYNVEKKKGEGDETCAAFSSALDSLLVNCSQSVASMIEGMKLVFDTMVAEVVKFSRLQDEACLDLKQRMETEMLSYQQTLESRHEKLKKDMVEERKADSLKQKQVLESIVCLFQEMEQKRENTMEETITSLDSTLSDSKLSLNSVLQFQRDRIDELALQNTEFSKLVTRSAEDACISQNLKKEVNKY